MKLLRVVLIFAVLSFALAGLFYYLTDNVIVSSWSAKMAEIGTIAIIIFIIMMILYVIARATVKGATKGASALRKKKPSDPEGPTS